MTDAKALHRDLMKALLTYIPQSIYHDIRHVVLLAWAIVRLCLTRTVRLTAWAEVIDGRATYAAVGCGGLPAGSIIPRLAWSIWWWRNWQMPG